VPDQDVHASSRTLAERVSAYAALVAVRRVDEVSTALLGVTLTHEKAQTLAGVPGNDIMIRLPEVDHRVARRRYSVRATHADELTLWVSVDHDGAGSHWAQRLSVGDVVDVVGPRGKIPVRPDAPWHLFVGDTTSIGAFARMAESVEEGTVTFIIELERVTDFVAPAVRDDVDAHAILVERRDAAPTDPTPILNALATHHLPSGEGHAYVFGELHRGRVVRSALIDRGIPDDHISLKAFWRSGVGNAEHGEPPRQESDA
jgi:NADPH-dependent ferric siderophore reductase